MCMHIVQVFVLGQGDTGQLGLGEEMMERKKPHPVGGDLSGLRVSQVVCGGMHTAALTDKGKVREQGSGLMLFFRKNTRRY